MPTCPKCETAGLTVCPACKGTGKEPPNPQVSNMLQAQLVCGSCRGSGYLAPHSCRGGSSGHLR
jgi:DnaJ-class molecular chaperone